MPNYASGAPRASASPLRAYLDVLRVRKWTIILVTLLVIGGTFVFSLQQTPVYTSKSEVLVKPIDPTSTTSTSTTEIAANMETERRLATSDRVAQLALKETGIDDDPEAFLQQLSVEVATSTEILAFQFSDPRPHVASEGAAAAAKAYLQFRRDQTLKDLQAQTQPVQQKIRSLNVRLARFNSQLSELEDQAAQGQTVDEGKKSQLLIQINSLTGRLGALQQQLSETQPPADLRVGEVVKFASFPSSPSSPNNVLNAVLALLFGLGLGLMVAFMRERLDDRIRTRHDVETHIGAPVLAVVPRVSTWRNSKQALTVALSQPTSASSEAYKTLRTSLLFAASRQEIKTLLITSPEAGEGKSVTAANLGVALARGGKSVVVVAADLRQPRLHRFLSIGNEAGLAEVLSDGRDPTSVLENSRVDNLRVLPSGPVPDDPAELLGSDRMLHVLNDLRNSVDFVLIDTTPVLAVADAMTLAGLADAVLFVVNAERTTRRMVDLARQQLEQVNANIIGAVLNNLDPAKAGSYESYGYYANRYTQQRDRTNARKPSELVGIPEGRSDSPPQASPEGQHVVGGVDGRTSSTSQGTSSNDTYRWTNKERTERLGSRPRAGPSDAPRH